MGFRILKKIKDSGLNSIYKFILDTTEEGETVCKEFGSKTEVDEYVEELLNDGVPKTSLEVVAVLDFKVSANIEEVECGCGGGSGSTEPVEYIITASPNGNLFSGSVITFVIDADSSKFTGVKIDGVIVPDTAYTVVSGSTVIEISEEYSSTLSVGVHEIEFEFTDGKVESTFTILEQQQEELPEEEQQPNENQNDEGGNSEGEEAENSVIPESE